MTEDERKQRKCPPITLTWSEPIEDDVLVKQIQDEFQQALIEALTPPFQVKIPYSSAGEAMLSKMFEDAYNRVMSNQPKQEIIVTVVIEK